MMMSHDLDKRAKEIIEEILYITIATASPEGQPWNSPVYSAHDSVYNFYWTSYRESQHSLNIRANSKVFLVIYDSRAAEGMGEGVYVMAKALELSEPDEISHAQDLLEGRKNKQPYKPSEVLGDYPRRVYKAIPEKFWMNGDGEIDGNYIDIRTEVTLHE